MRDFYIVKIPTYNGWVLMDKNNEPIEYHTDIEQLWLLMFKHVELNHRIAKVLQNRGVE